MGKRSRRKRRKVAGRWNPAVPDEVVSVGPIRIERYGRFLRWSNRSTPEEHARSLANSKKENTRVLAELAKEVVALQSVISRYDPVEIMHRAAYMILPLFITHRSESDFAPHEVHFLPAVEYLQYLVARTQFSDSSATLSEPEWEQVWARALKVMQLTQAHLMLRETLESPPSVIDELRFMLDNRRLAIRVKHYPIFLADSLRTFLEPYEQWILEIYGVKVDELINELCKIEEYQKTGLLDRYRAVIDAQRSLAEKLAARGFSIDPNASQEEVHRTREALARDEFKALSADLEEKMHLTFTAALFDITDLTSLPDPILSLLAVTPGESVLTALTGPAPEFEDLSPLSTSVLHYKPFLQAKGRFYTFYHSGFEDRIGEIVERELLLQRPGKVSSMARKRSDWMEAESLALLASIIKPDFVHQNVYYPNPDEEGGLTELDILFGVDDLLFLIEVKAGAFSVAASRGAPKSLERELSDLIVEGQRQSERAQRYIESADQVSFFDETGKIVVRTVRRDYVRSIIRVVVTREDLGWVAARIGILSVIDPKLKKSAPWCISIDDLRAMAQLFRDDELRCVHYLEQRLKASAEPRLTQHDEIDHVGLYNKINLYAELPAKGMDRMTFDASYTRDIDLYFMERAAGGTREAPRQAMPIKMKAFLGALQASHLPGRFEVASIILSMDADARTMFKEQGLDQIDLGAAQGKQLSFRIPFGPNAEGISVTYLGDSHLRQELFRSAAQMRQSRCTKWVVVQMTNHSPYVIGKIQRIDTESFTDTELADELARIEERARQAASTQRPGRNDPCPCGSGKKYKRCHGH